MKTQQNQEQNKYKTALIILIGLLAVGAAVSDLDNSDLNAVCNTNNSYLFKDTTGNWTCKNSATMSITTTGNIIAQNLTLTGNLTVLGRMSVKRPYMMISDNTTQYIQAIDTAQVVNFSTIEDQWLINITNKTNISVQQNGDYLVEISAIAKSNTQNKRFEIWVRKNGVDIPRSNTIYDFKGVGTAAVISVPFIIDMTTSDVYQIMIAGDSTDINIFSVAQTGHSPATPSIILTMSKISETTP